MLITKTDLLPYFDFSLEEARKESETLKPGVPIIELSATSGEGFDHWINYLKAMLRK